MDRDEDSCTYGISEPFKGDSIELTKQELPARDPLEGSDPIFQLLQAMRASYFEVVSFEWDKTGIDEYIEYKRVCHELLCIIVEGWVVDGRVDWDGFAAAATDAEGGRIRAKLAELGKSAM